MWQRFTERARKLVFFAQEEEAVMFQTVLQRESNSSTLTRLLTTGRPDPGEGEYDSGFLFLAGLVEDETLPNRLGIPPSVDQSAGDASCDGQGGLASGGGQKSRKSEVGSQT